MKRLITLLITIFFTANAEMILDEKQILKLAQKQARKDLVKEVTNQKVIDTYKINWPVKKVLSRAAAEKLVNDKATQLVNQNIPPKEPHLRERRFY